MNEVGGKLLFFDKKNQINCFSSTADARILGMTRIAVITDPIIRQQVWFQGLCLIWRLLKFYFFKIEAVGRLKSTNGIKDVIIYDEIDVEPTDVKKCFSIFFKKTVSPSPLSLQLLNLLKIQKWMVIIVFF